jgi:hypothetical protein
VNTEAFSPSGLKGKKELTTADLPEVVRVFLSCVSDPFIVLDESSKIKTTAPTAEKDKSTRTRLIKLLSRYGERMALTGTLMSKSPLNIVDQYQFLNENAFAESMFELAEKYCVMMTIHIGRGRRVLMPEHSGEKDLASWTGIRRRLINAYNFGGPARLSEAMAAVYRSYSVSEENQQWIMAHKEYTPFKDTTALMRRFADCTEVVSRADAFDTRLERYIEKPIVRKVRLGKKAADLYRQLVKLGFTDNLVLGKNAAMEMGQRLLDVCNGFEPVSSCLSCGKQEGILRNTCPFHDQCDKPKAEYRPLSENPKLDALMELLDEIDTEEHQVVVWSSRKNFMACVLQALEKAKIPCCAYSGDQTDREKADTREGFLSGKYRVCVANQQSASYGVNFMKNCDYTIYACSNASVEQDYQSRHRFLRGQTERMKYAYRLLVEGSVEERIYGSLDVGAELIGEASRKEIFELRG